MDVARHSSQRYQYIYRDTSAFVTLSSILKYSESIQEYSEINFCAGHVLCECTWKSFCNERRFIPTWAVCMWKWLWCCLRLKMCCKPYIYLEHSVKCLKASLYLQFLIQCALKCKYSKGRIPVFLDLCLMYR